MNWNFILEKIETSIAVNVKNVTKNKKENFIKKIKSTVNNIIKFIKRKS